MTSILAVLMITFGMGFANMGSAPAATLPPGEYDVLARCLSNSGVVKYGSASCPHCQTQKKLFGNSWQYINDVECTENGELCQEQNIKGYPTWIFYDLEGNEVKRLEGVHSPKELAKAVGCPFR